MRKLQVYLSKEAEGVIDELERMYRIDDPKGTLSQDISALLVMEGHEYRRELNELREKYGPAQPTVRPRGRPAKG